MKLYSPPPTWLNSAEKLLVCKENSSIASTEECDTVEVQFGSFWLVASCPSICTRNVPVGNPLTAAEVCPLPVTPGESMLNAKVLRMLPELPPPPPKSSGRELIRLVSRMVLCSADSVFSWAVSAVIVMVSVVRQFEG